MRDDFTLKKKKMLSYACNVFVWGITAQCAEYTNTTHTTYMRRLECFFKYQNVMKW